MSNSNNEIIINSTIGNTRIVLTKNQIIDKIFIERPDHQRTVGNIYKGKVQNVIPGMQAAFIDIGHSINAFLPFTEIGKYDVINDEPFSIEDSKGKSSDKKINIDKSSVLLLLLLLLYLLVIDY